MFFRMSAPGPWAVAVAVAVATAFGSSPTQASRAYGSPFPTPQFPPHIPQTGYLAAEVTGFDPAKHGLAFENYDIWSGSKLSYPLQLHHCTGMALLSRQVFLHGTFRPRQAPMDAATAGRRLRQLYSLHAGKPPGSLLKVSFPGYSSLYELSKAPEMEDAIKEVLGDSIRDALRPDWNWFPTDVFGWSRKARLRSDEQARADIRRGRPVIFYLLDGVAQAHAVLAYAFKVVDRGVKYSIYDPNYPGEAMSLVLRFEDGKVEYADKARDPFILYPYNDSE